VYDNNVRHVIHRKNQLHVISFKQCLAMWDFRFLKWWMLSGLLQIQSGRSLLMFHMRMVPPSLGQLLPSTRLHGATTQKSATFNFLPNKTQKKLLWFVSYHVIRQRTFFFCLIIVTSTQSSASWVQHVNNVNSPHSALIIAKELMGKNCILSTGCISLLWGLQDITSNCIGHFLFHQDVTIQHIPSQQCFQQN
jgi:hypothetical protein